ncbi:MAG: hypothetical protein K9J79_01435 [Desulfobacteraceae bacterium]|nr:hypothetical protein [Desulfobacteraceae bacterium]MCF8094001.1 hypothetical protein [Desulfobacteraceae bacterium]
MALTDQEKNVLKQAIFDGMSQRRQEHILKKGYDNWNPFEEPKDPLDIRMDRSKRTMNELVREFFQSRDTSGHGHDYRKGALEICLGIINEDERYIGMFDFANWYRNLLAREEGGEQEE